MYGYMIEFPSGNELEGIERFTSYEEAMEFIELFNRVSVDCLAVIAYFEDEEENNET